MNVLNRIKELQNERGWTNYQLSQEAALNSSTIENMFLRQTMPSMATLAAICEAFDISLSQFFCETENIYMTNDEITVIKKYRKLTKKSKQIIRVMLGELD